jgi:hypothetical protein
MSAEEVVQTKFFEEILMFLSIQNSHFTSSSSDYSSSDESPPPPSRGTSIRITAHRRGPPPRAPTVPSSPNTPSLDSASDSPPSSMGSRAYAYEYGAMPKPDDVYTGAFSYGRPPRAAEHYGAAPAPAAFPTVPPPPHTPKHHRKPAPAPIDVAAPVGKEVNAIIAEPDDDDLLNSPIRGGGPNAGNYLSAHAPPVPPPPPAGPPMRGELGPAASPPGPTQISARHVPHHHQVMPGYPPHYYTQPPMHVHPVSPVVRSEHSWEPEDDYEESQYGHRSVRGRPRNGVRHVPGLERESRSRPPPRSRSRGPNPRDREREARELERQRAQREVEEEERQHRRRHRSRSRHHHHHHHHHPREDPKYSAAMQAQIDAVRLRLQEVMVDPYAQEIIAQEGIKFDELLPKNMAAR